MLYIPLDSKPPSIEDRANIMRRNIDKGGVPVDYDRLLEYLTHSRVEQNEIGVKLLYKMSSKDAYFSTQTFRTWVKNNKITIGFDLTAGGSISYDDSSLKRFIDTNAYDAEITEIVKMYRLYNYYNAQVLQLPNIIKSTGNVTLESNDGRRLVILKPSVETQNTGRFGLTNPAFMNLPRYMKDLVVAPKGWTILSADSSQIEPKIIYGFYINDKQIQKLIEVEGDAYYAILQYCNLPQADIRNGRMEFTKTTITPELAELRSRLKTYSNGVIYGSTSNREKDPLKEAFINRIGRHHLRIEWQRKLDVKLNSGQRIFETLFGTPIDVYQSKAVNKAKDESSKLLALQHCVINNPVQGTAGDLMGFSLDASDRLFRAKSPNSWITKYVHDEGQYCVWNEDIDEIMEELSGHTSYNIGDVIKIYNDPKIGRTMNPNVPCSYEHLMGSDYL